MWAKGWQRLVWIRKRHQDESGVASNNASDLVVDIRDFVTQARREGWIDFGVGA